MPPKQLRLPRARHKHHPDGLAGLPRLARPPSMRNGHPAAGERQEGQPRQLGCGGPVRLIQVAQAELQQRSGLHTTAVQEGAGDAWQD